MNTLLNPKFKIEILSLMLPCMLAVTAASAFDHRPTSETEIREAIEHAAALRASNLSLVPAVLQKCAWLLKTGGVRCGHVSVEIADAKGEGGAVYKLIEMYKAAQSDGGRLSVVDYKCAYLLGADLSIISASLTQKSELRNANAEQPQVTLATCSIQVKGDKLMWVRSEQPAANEANGAPPAPLSAKGKLELHGQKPLPENALPALAVLAAAQQQPFLPESALPLCLPALCISPELDALSPLSIEPVFTIFALPGAKIDSPVVIAAQMATHRLVGDLTARGLEVDVPTPQVWRNRQVWLLDGNWHAVVQSGLADPSGLLKIEAVNPAELDENAPLDYEKIATAAKTKSDGAAIKGQ